MGRSRIKTLKINGRDVGAHEDETILELAEENGIFIPTLCRINGLSLPGACRLCLVEVKGWNKLVPACVTYADEGMEVFTDSERLQDYRRMIIELLFSEGNHVCAVCVSNGNCELQALAQRLGMDHVRFPNLEPVRQVDMTHDRFVIDRNRCVLCARCVRVCDEIEGAHVWDIKGRGIEARVITDLDIPWGESETCTSCGKCVNVCPVGAIVEKGKSIGEMVKRQDFLPYLSTMREAKK
ncbi:MAG: bidirectional hydrogenase complex protein HoxU [Anaerolineae bacterium]|nr:bidirectional hydrogenase complex protein HoxU [Anaerolineae bacterium]